MRGMDDESLPIARLAMRADGFGICAQKTIPAYTAGDAHATALDSAPLGYQFHGYVNSQQHRKTCKHQKGEKFTG